MAKAEDKLEKKKLLLVERTALALGVDLDKAAGLLRTEKRQSFRVNTVKAKHNDLVTRQLQELGWKSEVYDWYPRGFTIEGDKRVVSDSLLAREGALYVQNAASWLPVLALDPRANEKILDMCAAPGGKSSHILELTGNQAQLWINDNSRPRIAKTLANFKRLGVRATEITLFDVTRIAQKLNGQQFDKILLDAPCSGEGMMSLDNDKDFATWSVAHIRRLQSLQKQAVLQAWQLLKPGGTLIYSTCTMAPEENEMVIDYALRKCHGAELQEPLSFNLANKVTPAQSWNNKTLSPELSKCLRLAPSKNIEAFFVAKLVKPALDKGDI